MLMPNLAGKVARLRCVRTECRRLHIPQSPLPPPSFASGQYHGIPDGPSFPLYRNPPPKPSIPLTQETLDALPSDEALSRHLKKKVTKEAVANLPPLTEEDLRNFYLNLVKTGSESDAATLKLEAPNQWKRLSNEERGTILKNMTERLLGGEQHASLQAPQEGGIPQTIEGKESPSSDYPYKMLEVLSAVALSSGPSETSKGNGIMSEAVAGPDIPLGLVKPSEWAALFQEFISRNDSRAAEILLDVMNAHGMPVDSNFITVMLKYHAVNGRPEEVSRLTMEAASSGEPLEPIYKDMLILSYLRKTPSDSRPAIAHLRQAEIAGQPFPQSSYQTVIRHLVASTAVVQPNAHTRALAWDLFAHMRFAAHPTPTKELYSTMIRICGDAKQPEPERARDLWIEMTEQEKMDPGSEEYTAIIKALGGTKQTYLEAFDLLRQMLVKHHDATYVPFEDEQERHSAPKFSPYVPTMDTFISVMEGTKRAGDVNRARWVLAEVIKLSSAGQAYNVEAWKMGADDRLMASVFMTYAAWRPVMKRTGVRDRNGEKPASDEKAQAVANQKKTDGYQDDEALKDIIESSDAMSSSNQVASSEDSANQSPLSPLSAADALRECTSLFNHMIADAHSAAEGNPDFLPFRNISFSHRVLNSYISVHLVHGKRLATIRETYDKVWQDASAASGRELRPNAWTYIAVLEKCASGQRGGITAAERPIALEWGRQIWKEYEEYYKLASSEVSLIPEEEKLTRERRKWMSGIGDRQIERLWKAVIKMESVHGSASSAMTLLEEFRARFPPSDVTATYSPMPEVGLKIKMFTPDITPEAGVSPLIFFEDVLPLHRRLRLEGMAAEDRSLKLITGEYFNAAMKRRKWRMKGVGQYRERNKAMELERSLKERVPVDRSIQ